MTKSSEADTFSGRRGWLNSTNFTCVGVERHTSTEILDASYNLDEQCQMWPGVERLGGSSVTCLLWGWKQAKASLPR